MNQLVTVAKIVGPSGAAIVAMFRRWANELITVPESPTEAEHGPWPKASRDEMDRFADSLREHATEPPVAYYLQFADQWSMFDVFESGFPEPTCLSATSGVRDFCCYPLPDDGALTNHLRRMLRRRTLCDETRQYLKSLKNALGAWQVIADDGAIVVVRDVLGGLVMDEEFAEAAHNVPEWIKPFSR